MAAKLDIEERELALECDKHGRYTAKQVRTPQFSRKWRGGACPKCEEEREAERARHEKAQKRAQKRLDMESRFHHALIPPRFKQRTLDNYHAENDGQKQALKVATMYADSFASRKEHGGGLVFCGKPGTGKSHLAAAIANKVIPEGYTALWLTVMQAVRSVKETWSRDAERSESQAIRSLLTPDLLILDEVGVQFGSEAERIILFEIINGRYQEMLPTILISNLPQEGLAEYLGERVVDRMREGGGAVVAFDWESYRK